jgi:glycosyltransferase involved in cell wall biosynthesis
MKKEKILVFSALGYNSGCALRARYLHRAFLNLGFDSKLVLPIFPSLPFSIEVFLSIPWFLWRTILRRPALAVGIKPYPNVWLALVAVEFLKGKSVVDVDDVDFSYRRGLVGFISKWSQRPAFWFLKKFSTHHLGIIHKLDALYGLKKKAWINLPQGVDTKIFYPLKSLGRIIELRQKYNLGSRKILLFSAHLNVACQLETLLEWIEPFLRKNSDWILLVAGGGPGLKKFKSVTLNKLKPSQFCFTGYLSPEDINVCVNAAHICVSAYSEDEGNLYRVPMKLGEYLAVGKPVVTNPVSGSSVLNDFLYLCTPGAKSFGNQLKNISDGKVDGREKKGCDFVRKQLEWTKIAENFLAQM